MEETPEVTQQDPRTGDRRARDRRRTDRRTPVPPWRRPWAFAAYGAIGALLIFLAFRASGDPPVRDGEAGGEVIAAPAAHDVDRTTRPASEQPPLDAHSAGAFAQLVALGDEARGQRVNTELFCSAITSVSVRSVPGVPPRVAELSDSGGRVPGAECKWGSATAAPDFLLLIPPSHADAFAAAPMVEEGFVRRRRINVELEWLGRTESLALRTAGVLNQIR
jgi:hypothetical protein